MNFWRKLNKGCLFLTAIPFVILLGLWLFGEWVWGGSVKTSLDAQYIPTAEYLLQHPQPTPSSMQIYPNPGAILDSSDIVVMILAFELNKDGVEQWTQLFLNHQRIARSDIDTPPGTGRYWSPGIMLMDYAELTFDPNNKLNSGLHLFRIQIGRSFNDFLNPDPKLSYEWAYRVE